MSNNRFINNLVKSKDLPVNEEGYKLCRWCNLPVKPPRRTMCSPECVHELLIRTDGRYVRNCVYERDRGICALCNIDTKQIAKEILSKTSNDDKIECLKKYSISKKRKVWKRKFGGGLWDADHIIPVKEGGGECGLDNYRTLCIKCHKQVTKDSYKKEKLN